MKRLGKYASARRASYLAAELQGKADRAEALNALEEIREAMTYAAMELRQVHAENPCGGGCPTLYAIDKLEKALRHIPETQTPPTRRA